MKSHKRSEGKGKQLHEVDKMYHLRHPEVETYFSHHEDGASKYKRPDKHSHEETKFEQYGE